MLYYYDNLLYGMELDTDYHEMEVKLRAGHPDGKTWLATLSANVNEQLDLFTDYDERDRQEALENDRLEKEKALQKATVEIRRKFGKNAILKGTNFKEGAMTRERNLQIGGHKA